MAGVLWLLLLLLRGQRLLQARFLFDLLLALAVCCCRCSELAGRQEAAAGGRPRGEWSRGAPACLLLLGAGVGQRRGHCHPGMLAQAHQLLHISRRPHALLDVLLQPLPLLRQQRRRVLPRRSWQQLK